ncbi:hypothetical protein ABT297_23690 [Dactylosporangium sp. NPDC000555]|uniref:hypothetical protein n=1 Tax=Dactylosporangium sp. NPDC000555 TaxID=3154260 RepID=UPI003323DB9C
MPPVVATQPRGVVRLRRLRHAGEVVLTLLAYGLLTYGLFVPVALWLASISAG